eukprot:5427632-Heterocapsa_arctica.AAC.1
MFQTPVIEDSDVPALLGMKSMKAKRIIVDVGAKLIHFPGPGPVQIILPPGSKTYQLEETPTGHLLLPFAELIKHSPGNGIGTLDS